MAAAQTTSARRTLAEIPGVGPALAAKLLRRKITTRAQLRAVASELPRETQAHLRYRVSRSVPAATASAVVGELAARLVFAGPSGRRRRYPTAAVGSVRRGAARSKDLDLLVVVPDGTSISGLLASAQLRRRRPPARDTLSFAESYAAGDRRRSFIVRRDTPKGRAKFYAVDLFLATQTEKPFALFHYTGGRDYNIRVRAHAKRAGYVLNQYGLYCAAPRGQKRRRAPGSAAIKTERDLARFLGVTYRPPKNRSAK